MRRRILISIILALLCLAQPRTRAADTSGGFFLHDGDTVLIYGDSITEQQMYARDIETYVTTRFPKWRIKFINSGWSGDQVNGGGGGNIETRLQRDVLPYKPTVVTILLGMNDGRYTSYEDGIYKAYTSGLTHIIDELQAKLPGVRLTLLTPSMFHYAAKDRPEKPANQGYNYGFPAPNYNEVLIKFGDFIRKTGQERHILVADLNTPMVVATAKGRETDARFTLAGDGVHPNDVGHLIMAAAVLKAWHAPAAVADIALAPDKPMSITTPLPWPLPDSAQRAFAVSDLPGSLNVCRLHATGLPSGSYTLLVDGKNVGTMTSDQLAGGVDLTTLRDLPENMQAQDVLRIVQDRINRWHFLFKGGNDAIARPDDKVTPAETKALLAIDAWLDEYRADAHVAAQPKPHTFELRATTK